MRYFHKDALGSVDMITDINGNVVARQSYSPFGKREQNKDKAVARVRDDTNRGFTGHEHMDNGLINMNARLYDSETGRFLSADIYIQEPNLLLSHNRYIYVMNNPLKYSDPSGHYWQFIIGAVIYIAASQSDDEYVRITGMIIGGALMGGSTLFVNPVHTKMAAGFVMGGFRGGNFDLNGAMWGLASATMTYSIGHGGADGGSVFGEDAFFRTALAHGVVKGIIAEVQGGYFASGFAGGFAGHLSGVVTDGMGGDGFGGVVSRTTVAAALGGYVAQATGGDFEDGAFHAAMTHLFNTEVKRQFDKWTEIRSNNPNPKFRKVLMPFIKKAENKFGIRLRISEGRRSIKEQRDIYAKGRTAPGKVATYAKPGYSYHNYGLAVDLEVVRSDGSIDWEYDKTALGKLAESHGMTWGGRWKRIHDPAHVHKTFGLSISDLRQGERP